MSEKNSERKSRQSKIGKNFEDALEISRANSQEKVNDLKKQSRGETFSSITGRWSSALEGSREIDNMKLKAIKKKPVDVSEGFVSSRVTQLEQCVMQAQASAEQIARMLNRLMNVSSSGTAQVLISTDADTNCEDNIPSTTADSQFESSVLLFECDNTATYRFEESSSTYQHLSAALHANSEQPVALSCGVFMSSTDAQLPSYTAPGVMALAMRDAETGEPCIALTITSPRDPDSQRPSTGAGHTRVALFVPPHPSSQGGEGDGVPPLPLWEATFDIHQAGESPRTTTADNSTTDSISESVPSKNMSHMASKGVMHCVALSDDEKVGAEVKQRVGTDNCDEDSAPLNDTSDSVVLPFDEAAQSACMKGNGRCYVNINAPNLSNVSFDDSEASFGRGRGDYVSDSDSAIDEGDDVWTSQGGTNDDSTCYDTDISSVGTASLPSSPMTQARPLKIFSLEGGLPEIRNNVKRTTSVNEIEKQHLAKLAMEKAQLTRAAAVTNNIITMDSEPMLMQDNDTDHDNLAMQRGRCSIADTNINAFDIILASSSHNALIMQNREDNCTTVITTTLGDPSAELQATTLDAASTLAVSNDTLVQWTRAVAMSGYCTKWPMQNQKAGFRTKRFFILRDRTLSYHKHEPRNQEEARSDYAMHSIQLKHHFTVGRSSSRLTPCVKLDTGTDKLWFKCKSKRKEQQWIDAIRQGCTRYATPSPLPPQVSQHKVTSIWHHENPRYKCALIDVVDTIRGYGVVVAALFSCKNELAEPMYSLQCTTKEFGVALEPLDLGEAQHQPHISCMRIMDCNVLCLSGSSGYLGVAVLGEGSTGPVRKNVCTVNCRQFEGHSRNSCVTCLSYSADKELLVSGDIKGGLALWSHEERGVLRHLGKVKLQGDINSITFHPCRSVILVGTFSKLFMIGIWQRTVGNETISRLEGITLLDEIGVESVCCFYSTAFSFVQGGADRSDTADQCEGEGEGEGGGESSRLCLTIWKVETRQSSPLPGNNRSEETNNDTYSTTGCDFESMLELQHDDDAYDGNPTGGETKMEDINLSEREMSISVEKEQKRMSSKAESEGNKFCSRVCRYVFREECLLAAMHNMVPIERREVAGSQQPGGPVSSASLAPRGGGGVEMGMRTLDGAASQPKAYTTTRHYADEARAQLCSSNSTGVNMLLVDLIENTAA